jgi:hypothetical protein
MANNVCAFAMNLAKYDRRPANPKKFIDNNSDLTFSAWAGETAFDIVVPPHQK